MNAVMQLAEIYIQLCTAGCMLFFNFKATFLCQSDAGSNVFFQFEKESKDTEYVPPIMGSTNDVIQEMHDTSKFLQESLKSWKTHVEKQRSQYYYLNYYTTEQLVILQIELAKLLGAGKLDKRIFHMLHAIGQHYTYADLTATLKAALEDIDKIDEDTSAEKTHEIAEFIAYLVNLGYTKSMALRALQSGITTDARDAGSICFYTRYTVNNIIMPGYITDE